MSNGRHSRSTKPNGRNKPPKDDSKHSEDENQSTIRIWICSWNMAAKEHFKCKLALNGRRVLDDDVTSKFEQTVPTNYDLYVFGVQEGTSDTFFKYIARYLSDFDVQRLPLTNNNDGKNKKTMNKNANCFGVHGRGDGSFINTKFTGLAIYYRRALSAHIKLKASCAVSCGITQGSKGAACVLLKIHSSTIAFLSTHISSNSTDAKLEHFKILVNKCGDQLGCSGFDLIQQFHHIVWFGDLNYRIIHLNADTVLQKMAFGHLRDIWDADSLNQELRNRKQCAFKNFKEPKPRLDFYPTYKKNPDRQLDFDRNPKELAQLPPSESQTALSQLNQIYTTKYKEPIYKGGQIKDRIPSFCDRVLYHSLVNGLQPEQDQGVLNCVEFSYKKDNCNNYGCIPQHLMGSDHSAIYCGMTLKSPLLFPCPPDQCTEQGDPKSYQLKIESIKILRKSIIHRGSTYSEVPLKTKICFPAPFEMDNDKYNHCKPFSASILQFELEMYRTLLRQLDEQSKMRLLRQKQRTKNNEQRQNVHALMTPQISQKIPKTVIDMLDVDSIETAVDADESEFGSNNDNTVTDTKKVKKNTSQQRAQSVTGMHMHASRVSKPKPKPKPRNKGAVAQSMTSNTSAPPSGSETEDFADIDPKDNKIMNKERPARRPSAPHTQAPQIPNDYIFRSEASLDPEKQKIEKAKNTTTVDGGFMFSMDFKDTHTFNMSSDSEPNNTAKHRPSGSGGGHGGGIQKDNPLHSFLESSSNEEDEHKMDLNAITKDTDLDLTGFNRVKSSPLRAANTALKSAENTKKPLNKSIVNDNYFDQTQQDMANTAKTEDMLRRTRSKSMGSSDFLFDNTDTDAKATPKTEPLLAQNDGLSPIYKELNEYIKRLTIISYGPRKRPIEGNIHCVLKVETNDMKGQCCIALGWDDFGKNVEQTKSAALFHHGIPLYDKTGAPITLKVRYKLSLVDTQVVFQPQ